MRHSSLRLRTLDLIQHLCQEIYFTIYFISLCLWCVRGDRENPIVTFQSAVISAHCFAEGFTKIEHQRLPLRTWDEATAAGGRGMWQVMMPSEPYALS